MYIKKSSEVKKTYLNLVCGGVEMKGKDKYLKIVQKYNN